MPHVMASAKRVFHCSDFPGHNFTITTNVTDILHDGEESVSVALEEVKAQDWEKKVYEPDVKNKWETLYKKSGYDEHDL